MADPLILSAYEARTIAFEASFGVAGQAVNRTGFAWCPDPAGGPDCFALEFEDELAAFSAFNGCKVSR